ncbi:hypothetical protein ACFOLJ_19655 [Rugamonas sp. CCM 8940]|uniref:hypothetical protein n=1 Tax=Rugamonas sp. CCM 8940 TaxID=2765359 RepID=UPI001F3AA9AB|nr:hypothetical protein [Rugamonas sp. CCM 8940]
MAALAVGASLGLLSGAALAEGFGDQQGRDAAHDQRDQRDQRSQPARDPRQLDPRTYEARAEEQRRAMQDASHNAEVNRRVGRLTPDERRDLRRQINEAGQDIYATPPRR